MKTYLRNLNNIYSLIKLSKYGLITLAILTAIDFFDLPSKYLFIYGNRFLFTYVSIIILLVLLTALEFNLLETYKMAFIGIIDGCLYVFIFTFLFYGFIMKSFSQLYLYKIKIIALIEGLSLLIMITRGIKHNKYIKSSKSYKPNLYDLKDIYDGSFITNNNEIILVEERDIDYDLLDRTNAIKQLYDAIINSNPDNRFVISLEGKWGSGKTTIINIVKRMLLENSKNILIIDEFDPWSYCDQESLFLNMFDIILKKSGYKYSFLSIKQMIENISENIFGSKEKSKLIKGFFKQNNKISDIKRKINNYLETINKKVVFFIDNLDRTESENIILLFKLIGNVFDFEHITYVLSFDDEQVKRVFENNYSLDYRYLKKIIQMQIRVPQIDKSILINLFSKCIENILIAYGENKNEIKKYQAIIDCICKNSNDIRDLKRFINSVLFIPFKGSSYLNKRDLLAIESIRFYNYELYMQIYQNRQYFISHDKIFDEEVFGISFRKKEFNENGRTFFDNLFLNKQNNSYKDILKELFPYVKRYENNQDLEYDGFLYLSDSEYNDIALNNRICSAKYFDLYFANTVNNFLLIGKIIDDFFNESIEAVEYDEQLVLFNDYFEKVHISYHRELFERLQLNLNVLSQINAFNMSLVFFNNIFIIDNSRRFIGLSARERVEYIIWELMQKMTDEHFVAILKEIKNQYNKIENISSILNWFEHDKEGKGKEDRKQKLKLLYKEMCEKIINDNINLYDDLYYYPKNIWGLCRFYKEDSHIIKNYIKNIMNEKNIFRMIYDITGLSIGTKYEYSINKKNLDFLTSKEEIDLVLKKVTPITEDQRFVVEIYNSYKNGTKNEWGEACIVTDEERVIMP